MIGLRDLARLVRVKQWTKGVFVFAALLFTRGWERPEAVRGSLVAFAAMTLASVAMYLFNDLRDLSADRAHPTKRDRPLAAGRILPSTAGAIAVVAGLAALTLPIVGAWGAFDGELSFVVALYMALQIVYNLGLKRVAVADVATIATGFVLRVVAGAVAIRAPLSGWILLCTAFLALLLGFGKRRHEFRILGLDHAVSRPALKGYTLASLDALLVFSAGCAAISYGVYSIESRTARENPGLIMTTPFVVYGIARYLTLVMADGEGGEPESLVLRDVQLIVCFLGFAITAVLALRGYRVPFIQ